MDVMRGIFNEKKILSNLTFLASGFFSINFNVPPPQKKKKTNPNTMKEQHADTSNIIIK